MNPQIDFAKVIAHRGASAEYPENTWLAFEQARLQGARWLELDVWVSAAGVPVVFHDESLTRMTNGVGKITEVSSEYLSSLKIKQRGKLFKNERIPYFEDVLVWLDKYQLSANIELKSLEASSNLQLSAKIICDLIKCFPSVALIISSFSTALLIEVRRQLPDYRLGLLVNIVSPERWQEKIDEHLAMFKRLNCFSLHVNERGLDQNQARQLKQLFACPLLSYTVNDVSRAKELLSWGVDAVFSDYPELLKVV
ncbi:glycerophosphodiester phosphodiesterase family protein [Piscirickettsia litoralis]|uniref:Glycerophosphodiester phosphodiesterase n=1 Tax=Piscirickettsia litoralis TaxID=1891921 RepID=A0ABX3A1Z8_9GAMM|nr:glycerophosphodiester phosphodiesterase family protein [Piscirickettsia litoralis]ODN42853.1 glycerophosphodiester phosphodiesterase [Piscirickettsia litoralis]